MVRVIELGNVGELLSPNKAELTKRLAIEHPDWTIIGIDKRQWIPAFGSMILTNVTQITARYDEGLMQIPKLSINRIICNMSLGYLLPPPHSSHTEEYTANIASMCYERLAIGGIMEVSAGRNISFWYYDMLESSGFNPKIRLTENKDVSYSLRRTYEPHTVSFSRNKYDLPVPIADIPIHPDNLFDPEMIIERHNDYDQRNYQASLV